MLGEELYAGGPSSSTLGTAEVLLSKEGAGNHDSWKRGKTLRSSQMQQAEQRTVHSLRTV